MPQGVDAPLDEQDIAELAEFFDLLARFDFEDKIREEGREDGLTNTTIV